MINLGKLKIENAALAPMAGFTDSAYRLICKQMGAGLVVSEMISAKALCFGDKKTAEILKFCGFREKYILTDKGFIPVSL